MCFGFGDAICPDCYLGEQSFLTFDDSYWLNRIIIRILNLNKHQLEAASTEQTLLKQMQPSDYNLYNT